MQATETVLTLPAVKIKLLRIAARKIAIMQRIPAATKIVQNQCLITSKNGSFVCGVAKCGGSFSFIKIDILDLIIDTELCKNCDRVEKQQ